MTRLKIVSDDREDKRQQEKHLSDCFYYATYVTGFLVGFLFLYLRSRNFWIGDIMILSYPNTIVSYFIAIGFLLIIKCFINGYYRAIDSFAIATIPLSLYVNIRTAMLYTWMKRPMIVLVIVLIFFSMIAMFICSRIQEDKSSAVKRFVSEFMRFLSVISMIMVVFGLEMCRQQKDIIDHTNMYFWRHEEKYLRESTKAELDNLCFEDFRQDRFCELTKVQREHLIDMLVLETMDYLTDGELVPDVEHDHYFVRGDFGDYDDVNNRISISRELYNPQTEDEVELLVSVVFHECYHAYQHYCIETMSYNDSAAHALYYRQIEAWRQNEEDYYRPDVDFFSYQHQALETDAEEFAEKWAERMMVYIDQ